MENDLYIPAKPDTYAENTTDDKVLSTENPLIYEIREGEKILVLSWVKYPSYDFIFGVPSEENPHYGKEVGFFQYRDTRTKTIRQGFYVDANELLEMVEGFTKIFSISKRTRPEMWNR